MILFTSLLGCKFCHAPPLYVVDCSGRIYCVVHRLQSMSRTVIHLGVHNHLVAYGKCWEFVEKTKRLITEEVDCMLDVKISSISFSASKTFLVSYLLDDYSDGTGQLLKGGQLEHMQEKFCELRAFPTFLTLLLLSNVI